MIQRESQAFAGTENAAGESQHDSSSLGFRW